MPCKRVVLVVLVGLLCSVSPGYGTDSDGYYVVYGLGSRPCARALLPDGTRLQLEMVTWVSGALTGVNLATSETFGINPAPEMAWQWIAQYCRMNQFHTLAQAVEAFVRRAMPARLRSLPETSYPDAPTGPVEVPRWDPPVPTPKTTPKSIPVKSKRRS